MPIKFRCAHCGKKIKITSRAAGRNVNCPKCGDPARVPSPNSVKRASKPYQPHQYLDAEADAGDFQLRKRAASEDDLDLTPMVDVTFQLLIFFILTASMSLQKAIAVPPPDPQREGAQSTPISLDDLEVDSIIVEIQADNTIIVDDEPLAADSNLAEMLQQSMDSSGRHEMVINAHADSFHETTVTVFDAANEVGMQKIRMTTTGGEDDE
ncbi:Biopolymer transport protein ExbD/TolR [Symmachiella macrocystis]|uniref:Biopolymer transport protein ExbD/TolR n=1 Tax=Symmachiella macrocystis TaxID=2527985 RepID=A0A5C6BR79_9PLAN|nr:biopolymer transporter ExbD [Symmachiella macrocystis]TWU13174.1 Biopolymer transport protein ExbD/TolR [Symmachiella macrocystis]